MKNALRILSLLSTLIAGAAAAKDCSVSYDKSGYAVNAENGWTYFRDTVVDATAQPDGSLLIGFEKSPKRFLIAKDDAAFRKAALASLEARTSVHVAVKENSAKSPKDVVPPARLLWIDAKAQHESCK